MTFYTFLHTECSEATKTCLQEAASFQVRSPEIKSTLSKHLYKLLKIQYVDSSETICTSLVWYQFAVWLEYTELCTGANSSSQQTMTTKVIASHNMSSNNSYGLRNYKQLSQFNEPNISSKLSTLFKPVVCFRAFM